MKVFTHRPFASAVIEMSTGSGIFAGSPMAATSFAAHFPCASRLISQSCEVSAVAVMAQS